MTQPARPSASQNRLLSLLPRHEMEELAPLLQRLTLEQKQPLYRTGDLLTHIYFPSRGMISVLVLMEDGAEIEVATIGKEGMVSAVASCGVNNVVHQVTVQLPGEALRLPRAAFQDALRRLPRFHAVMMRYLAYSWRSSHQLMACNALHALEQRMCRWLLMTHDCVEEDTFPLTQEFLAQMLGVRRQTVSEIAAAWQRAGVIAYRRGEIRILNRRSLEAASCDCYQAISSFYAQMFGKRER
jgi:CRP-like cAMP-binding protein